MNLTVEEHLLANQTMAYWANFAKTGDPNGEGLACLYKGMMLTRKITSLQSGLSSHPRMIFSCTWARLATMPLSTTSGASVISGPTLGSSTDDV